MSIRILGDHFRRVGSPSIFDGQTDRERGRAELDRIKLTQHPNLTRDQRIVLNEMLDKVDEDLEAKGLGDPQLSTTRRQGKGCMDSEMQAAGQNPAHCLLEMARYTNRREKQIMESIDGVVDRYLTYTEDKAGADHAQTVGRSLERGRGDCEDYAILKYKMARASGIDAKDLAIVSLDSSPSKADGGHAVLMYKDNQSKWHVVTNDDTQKLIPAEEYFNSRSVPYRAYNENEAGFNVRFSDMSFTEYVNENTGTLARPR